MTVASKEEQGS